MIALVLITLTIALLVARQSTAANPVRITEHSARVLIWLEHHKNVGNSHSRANVRRRHLARIWYGLRRAGVIWGNAQTGGGFYCLHRHEGAWNSNTGNGYWGGLQMDYGYYHSYGRDFIPLWSTPDNWPIWAQMIAGYRGYQARGWAPWGTRGACDL